MIYVCMPSIFIRYKAFFIQDLTVVDHFVLRMFSGAVVYNPKK